MARRGSNKALPPPLPPATRTVGQLVAESLRAYAQRFWVALPLGLSVAVIDLVAVRLSRVGSLLFVATWGAVLLTTAYAAAVLILERRRVPPGRFVLAGLAGVLAFLPFPFLATLFVIPAVAWLALVGLVVPVVLLEGRSIRAGFARAVELARADYVHALGSLCTLVLVYVLARLVLFFLLRGYSRTAAETAALISDVIVSPVLFLGAALLYADQVARVGSPPRSRRRGADVHPAVEADHPGRADAEVESRPAPRGQPRR